MFTVVTRLFLLAKPLPLSPNLGITERRHTLVNPKLNFYAAVIINEKGYYGECEHNYRFPRLVLSLSCEDIVRGYSARKIIWSLMSE